MRISFEDAHDVETDLSMTMAKQRRWRSTLRVRELHDVAGELPGFLFVGTEGTGTRRLASSPRPLSPSAGLRQHDLAMLMPSGLKALPLSAILAPLTRGRLRGGHMLPSETLPELRVFIASPGDAEKYAPQVEEAVRTWNQVLAKTFGVSLQVTRCSHPHLQG
jgi:hypothetical protein